jgi:hypothetical protein
LVCAGRALPIRRVAGGLALFAALALVACKGGGVQPTPRLTPVATTDPSTGPLATATVTYDAYDKENSQLLDAVPLPDGADRAREVVRSAPYFPGRLFGAVFRLEDSSAEEVLTFYREGLPAEGWALVQSEEDSDLWDKGDARLTVNVAQLASSSEFIIVVDSRCAQVAEGCKVP